MGTELNKEEYDAFMVLLDDVRAEVIEASKTITAALEGPPSPVLMGEIAALRRALEAGESPRILANIEDVKHLVEQIKPTPKPYWLLAGSVVLAGLIGLAGGWLSAGCPADLAKQAAFASQLDTLLEERYSALPSPVQTALAEVYKRHGIQPVGQRKAKK